MDGSPLNLVWYHRTQTENASKQIQTGFVSQTYTASRVETQLTIPLWKKSDNVEEHFKHLQESSAFFCRVTFANGTLLSDSQEIQLFPQITPAIHTPNKTCDGQKVHSAHTRKCIEQPKESPTASPSQLPTSAKMNETIMKSDSTDDFASGFDDEILLYFAIGAVLLLVIVIFVLVLCLCVCNRLCKHSGYCTCCV